MEIKIQRTSSIQDLQARNHVRFIFFAKQMWPRSSIYFLGGLILILFSLYDNYLIEFTRTLGILVIFYFFILLYQLVVIKQQLRKSLDRYIHRVSSFAYEIYLNKEAVYYKDFEFEQTSKWSTFSSYVSTKDYIIIFSDNNVFSSVVFFKRDVTESEYNTLNTFLKNKLPSGHP
jgi:hypothetical protein